MLISITEVLSTEDLNQARAWLEQGQWQDGKITAGGLAKGVKHNLQLVDDCPPAESLRQLILTRLNHTPQFIAAALPNKIYPPKFNCYQAGGSYGAHIDSAIMTLPNQMQMRTDVSCTVFLNDPDSYDGGELCIEGQFGVQEVKLSAGDLILYPSTSLHRVNPVTRGQRLCSFFWIESLIKHSEQRGHLYDLDNTLQELTQQLGADAEPVVSLSGLYHNLVRLWSNA